MDGLFVPLKETDRLKVLSRAKRRDLTVVAAVAERLPSPAAW